MPRFEPFPGLRFSTSHVGRLDDVVCPPYDIVTEDERRALLARSPHNVIRLELPVADGGGDPYAEAATLLDAWRDGGVLARDRQPAFYGYRMRSGDRSSTGVIGALGLEPPGQGILPHEETTPKAKTDRLSLLRALHANTSPIWALTPVTGLAELAGAPAHPAEHVLDDDGTTHELWPIVDADRVAAISAHVAQAPVLVADGHHRYETALAYQAEHGDGDAGAVMALVVELDEAQLDVQPIHRLVDGVAAPELLEALGSHFTLTPTPLDGLTSAMEASAALGVVTGEGAWVAAPTSGTSAAATHDLDASRLAVALADVAQATLRYQHGADLAVAAVRAGQATAAVLVRPATVAQIADISRGGVRMPAKTTFFWPKPRTGMVLRELIG